MRDEGAALRAAILADPADDTVRLVFADWLDENKAGGKERGGFIRFQLDSAHHDRMDDTGDRFVEFADEAEVWPYESWADSATTLFELANRGRVIEYRWQRGFIDRITCSAEDWLRFADAVVWHPTQMVVCGPCKGTGEFRFTSAGTPKVDSCNWCVAGRKPRPFPVTAQPIESVTLTTRPDVRAVAARGYRLGEREHIHESSPTVTMLAAEWPGIAFTLPAFAAGDMVGLDPDGNPVNLSHSADRPVRDRERFRRE